MTDELTQKYAEEVRLGGINACSIGLAAGLHNSVIDAAQATVLGTIAAEAAKKGEKLR